MLHLLGILIISTVIALAFALLLYFREKRSAFSKKQKTILAIIRGITIFIISILAFSLFIKNKIKQEEKPIIALLQDNSQSIVLNSDSAFYKTKYINDLTNFINKISSKAEVVTYAFDENVRNQKHFDFKGNLTNIGHAIEDIRLRYENRNICGLVLATDGIANIGQPVSSFAEKLNFPVYTVGLGDTTKKPDIKIKELKYNKNVVFGNRFPIVVSIQANQLKGRNTQLTIIQNGVEVEKQNINIASSNFFETYSFMLNCSTKQPIKIEVVVKELNEEYNVQNNKAVVYINVIEDKYPIAIIYSQPHPDISAIKFALEQAQNFEVSVFKASEASLNDISKFKTIVLFQVPSKLSNDASLIQQILKFKIPVIFTLGFQSDINKFNNLNTGIRFLGNINKSQEAFISQNSQFGLFNLSEQTEVALKKYPPLLTFFGDYQLSSALQVFAYQRIGNVSTNKPLIAFQTSEEQKFAFILGEGIFKWKMQNYLQYKNFDYFNEIIQKIVNLLVQQADKNRLRVFHKNVYFETEDALITAEVYNKSMELTTKPTLTLTLKDKNNNLREFIFSPQFNNYRLNIGKLDIGEYRWTAECTLDGEKLSASGVFFVEKQNIENQDLVANHSELKYLSKQTNGTFIYPQNLDQLADEILNNPNLKTIEYYEELFVELISLKWLAFIIIALLTIEWALRKFWGYF